MILIFGGPLLLAFAFFVLTRPGRAIVLIIGAMMLWNMITQQDDGASRTEATEASRSEQIDH
jgi:hypothetical protein